MTAGSLRSNALAAMAATSLLAAGCGGSEEDKVRDAVRDFAAATKDKDSEKFCGLLSKDSLELVEKDGKECEKEFDEAGLEDLAEDSPDPDEIEFSKVTVEGKKATVKIKGEESDTELVKEDGDWKFAP